MKPQTKSKVVPFTGEFYPTPEPQPQINRDISPLFTAIALAMVSGVALGAIVTHQSAGYQQMNQLKNDSAQLQRIKKSVCGF